MSNPTNPGERGRSSSQRKTAAVLRLLRGEAVELVSRELGLTAATLSGWRDDFLAGGQAALCVRHFATVAELVEALREFGRIHNEQWLIERHGFRTPSQARVAFS
jgi:transposase-like protein